MEVENRKKIKKEEEEEQESSPSDVVRWGRFPPGMVLRVLLVEDDDSTRQIIAALLRKCSYKVVAVPDGLKAWEALKRTPHSIDLILTEVELPSISGYALLTLVMEHDICKNIPVIMMSSQDSISVVLKCMLKGAADFLIKPVRRNELRNLWQHVWRRQTQTAGLVPENTTIEQQKGEVTSGNNAASNHFSGYINSIPKYKECSEKGSDAHSSCTKPCVEAESAYLKILQVPSQLLICGNGSKLSNTKTHGEQKFVMKSVMPTSEIGVNSTGIEAESASCNEVPISTVFNLGNDHVCDITVTSDSDLGLESHRHHPNIVEVHCNGYDLDEPSSGALDLIGRFEQHSKDTLNLGAINDTNKFSCAPELELSLTRFHPTYPKDEETDERHMLSHSNASAFTRYNNVKASGPNFQTLTSDSSEVKKGTITLHGELSNQATENTFGTQSHDAALSSGYGRKFLPTFYKQSGHLPLLSPNDQREPSPFLMSSSLLSSSDIHNPGVGDCLSEKTTNLCYCHFVQEEDKTLDSVGVPRHGSPIPALSGNGSLSNDIARIFNSGVSENMCNETDGNTTPATAAVITSISEGVNDSHLFIPNGLKEKDSHCSSQREAALLKFRLKRKERCFDKKVRYQSRKTLAEQRPRVKGQFVRHVQTDLPPGC